MNWIRLDEYSVVGSLSAMPLAIRLDTILAFGTCEDGMTWVRTQGDTHKVTASFQELTAKINAPEWASEGEASGEEG